MLSKAKLDWDDLDIYDREAAEIYRALQQINLDQWVKDLKSLEPELFDKLYSKLHHIKNSK